MCRCPSPRDRVSKVVELSRNDAIDQLHDTGASRAVGDDVRGILY
jgi:hypothetical protein